MVTVTRTDPVSDDALRLIAGSEAEQAALYPPEDRFAASPDQLVADDVRFFVAYFEGEALGCCGYAVCDGYGELKRMYAEPAARGTGIASALIEAVETAARAEGIALMRLETGQLSPAAIGLYTRHGYIRRGPFGDYPENGSSVFMEKPL
ncbi:GNAT family N-acetyltransferase [Rhodophyticola sp. CCM32]|uniref:GNAT family N-acetyltransferase n=1 Tax=Rhodophyticola sp. CCM32 TaxID=2916397 RepID=UPI00107F8CB1|nr:GNAT family N-acetyltransferase [Rhodophyticola sp. CCM32]QBY01941.1 GNAT family N-acetyltransferase [Rhodophyticola sp. CCM32]